MGEIVLAAKVTHVPSLMISERPESPIYGTRKNAIESLKELGRRARARGADTYIVFDTHWISNFGCHMNAKAHHKGLYTSHEAPHMIRDLEYDLPGNPDLGDRIHDAAHSTGLEVLAHKIESLPLEYGTIVPMHYMNADGGQKVISVAAPIFASIDENRMFGEAVRRAILESPYKVAVLASGSLSHRLVPNAQVSDVQYEVDPPEFNRQVDLRVLDLWAQGRWAEFCKMLPDYTTKCNGEALMADTHMLFGMLGWDQYKGRAEQLCDYFSSSGSGQINVEFHL